MSKDYDVKEVFVSVGLTINMGNYNSAKVDAGITLTAKEGSSYEELYDAAWGIVQSEVREKALDIKSKSKAE